jgi:tetratricopeptide (TPR) repeat protein
MIGLANCYMRMNRASDAIEVLHKALTVDALYAPVHYHLGIAYTMLGDKQHALESLGKAFSLDPQAREAAMREIDLQTLHTLPEFQDLVAGRRRGGF